MGLRGQFSNLSDPLSGLLSHSLTDVGADQDVREVKTTSGWPDGRRRFGTVSNAIVEVLATADGELRVKEVRARVEARLGGPVSRFSVSDYLLTRSKGPRPLFGRTGHGRYLLLERRSRQGVAIPRRASERMSGGCG